ncbi:branched chain amino acid ABC transporter substrate-binding protein [Bacteroidia bacterium]|nr:branched chain amino acid ABC transporter substrate-binding protein [Bacteroidia bacterium]
MNKKYLFGIIIVLLVGVIAVSVFNRKKENNLVVGSLLPLSGQYGAYGTMAQRGQLLALDEIKSKYNDSIKIAFFDTEYLKDVALSRLMEAKNNNVKYFVEIFGSDQVEHCLDYAYNNNLFVFSGVDTKPDLVEKGKGNFACIMPSDADATREIFLWMEEQNMKNVAILYVNDDWGEGLLSSALYNLSNSSLNLVGQFDINRNQQSFTSTVSKIKEKNPDALCVFIYPDDGGRFIKEASRQNLKAELYATENFTGNDMIKTAQSLAEGVKLIIPATSGNNPVNKQLVEKYMEKYKEEPTIFALKGYDAVLVLYDVLQKAKNIASEDYTIDDVKNVIRDNYHFYGATGDIGFNEKGEFIPTKYERMVYTIKDKEIQLVPVK